ncbi:MAG: leucine-rich repeat domain-containing protein, partial [Parabacteroides gordonii]|nr:leucine-rich repeat domain-containing protein [Parabacteroides gordonii]
MQRQLLITLLAFTLTGHAYAEPDRVKASIYCESAGRLADSLAIKGFTDLSVISNLNVRGIINAEDFRHIKTMYALDSLDISQVEIEAFYGYGTYEPGLLGHNKARNYPANAIPMNAFNHRSDYNNSLTGLKHLSYVKLPATLTDIESEAFAYCKNLSDVELNDRLEKIGANAFTSTALTSVTLPASVISMGGEQGDVIRWSPVFDNCTSLERIEVDQDNTVFKSVDGVLYSADGYYLRQYPAGKKDTEYEIQESTVWLCHMSFSGAQTLQTISIASSVERLERAFWNCPALTTVNCKAKNPPIWYAYGASTLVEPFDSNLIMNGLLIVPKGTKDVYQKDTFMGWGMFNNIKEEDSTVANQTPEIDLCRVTTSNKTIFITQTGQQRLDISIYTYIGQLLYKQSTTALALSFP